MCPGSERKVRKKRRLVIDELKSIASETMKLQLSDTSEIVSTLDLAPPTKKLMHWKETGGVEKLFAFPGRQIVSRKLSRVNVPHLSKVFELMNASKCRSSSVCFIRLSQEHALTLTSSHSLLQYTLCGIVCWMI